MDFYNLESLKLIAEQNRWLAIWPELLLALFGVVLLMLEIFLPLKRRTLIPHIAIIAQISLLVAIIVLLTKSSSETYKTFSGLLTHSYSGNVMRLFFMLASLCISFLACVHLSKKDLPQNEFHVLVMFITAGLMLLGQSSHFLMLFITLEAVTIGFYILIAYHRNNVFSLEASFKYLILSASSSAIMLLGIVFLYGVAGNPQLPQSTGSPLDFSALGTFIAANTSHPLVLSGTLFVLIGIIFKIGAVPFQIWVPDVYQGAFMPTTAFLATASKAGGFIVLLHLVHGPFSALHSFLTPLFTLVAVATLLFGNIAAAGQRNVKRLMGLSGVAHSGYLLAGVVASFTVSWAFSALSFYLFAYLLASFLVFAVMILLAQEDDTSQELSHYQNMLCHHPFLATVLVIGLGSLAGVPPLIGFIGKALIFYMLFLSQHYFLLSIALIGVIISMAYYFGWILNAFARLLPFSNNGQKEAPIEKPFSKIYFSWDLRALMILLSGIVIMSGFFQGIFHFLFHPF